MATVDKTWTWDSGTESFSLTAGSDSTLVRDTGNGSPTNGSLKHVTSGRNKSSLTVWSHADLTAVTWETLGVPAGATVNTVQVLDVRTYYGLTDTVEVDQYGPAIVHLYANGTTTEVTGAALYTRAASTGSPASPDGSWQTGSAGATAVGGSYQSSTQSLDVIIDLMSDNGNNGSAASSVHFDYLSIRIDYTAAAAGPTAFPYIGGGYYP